MLNIKYRLDVVFAFTIFLTYCIIGRLNFFQGLSPFPTPPDWPRTQATVLKLAVVAGCVADAACSGACHFSLGEYPFCRASFRALWRPEGHPTDKDIPVNALRQKTRELLLRSATSLLTSVF